MRIGLMGFEFVSPNKGCEALTYAFLRMLNEMDLRETTIVIFSEINTIGDIKQYYPSFDYQIVNDRLKDLTFETYIEIRKCDIIFDITMGDSFSDIYAGKKSITRILKKRITEILNRKYILLPQTYGPFSFKYNEIMAMKVIDHAWKVYARDSLSIDYIRNHIKDVEVYLSTDLAFYLPYKKQMYKFPKDERIKIGLNVSGLLWRGGFSGLNQFGLALNYKEYIGKLIDSLKREKIYAIYLIPHVIDLSNKSHDDDYKISKEISEKYGVSIAPVFNNPIEAKSFIANMDCFIGARMHSTIAAYSSGIPTIPFSYSRKFEGLFQSLEYNYVIHGNQTSLDNSIKETLEYIVNRKKIKEEIERNSVRINNDMLFLKEEIHKLVLCI